MFISLRFSSRRHTSEHERTIGASPSKGQDPPEAHIARGHILLLGLSCPRRVFGVCEACVGRGLRDANHTSFPSLFGQFFVSVFSFAFCFWLDLLMLLG